MDKKISWALSLDLLAIVLLILKIFDLISISWIWVLAPWWIPISFAAGMMIASKLEGADNV